MVSAGVEQRTWDDLTYGTLSSDGRRVYSVEDVKVDLRRDLVAGVSGHGCRYGPLGMVVTDGGMQWSRSIPAIGWLRTTYGPANWSGSWAARCARGKRIRFSWVRRCRLWGSSTCWPT